MKHNNRGSETKESILRAGRSLFYEHGYKATTARMIAGQANINLGLIDYYFKEMCIRDSTKTHGLSDHTEYDIHGQKHPGRHRKNTQKLNSQTGKTSSVDVYKRQP